MEELPEDVSNVLNGCSIDDTAIMGSVENV